MENFDNVLVIDADGHVYEGNVDLRRACRKSGDRRRRFD